MTINDVAGILELSRTLPTATNGDLITLWEKFKSSKYNEPQFDLVFCLNRFVSMILILGMERIND